MSALAARILKFKQKIPRLHALRRLGIRVQQMVRSAGTPAITYGVESTGMADSHLERARNSIAKAAAPEGGGKSVDLVLLTADRTNGTMDPAFDAHVLPVYYWSLAWWEGWKPHNTLTRAGEAAIAKLHGCAGSCWRRVCGPATAVVATLGRIGWDIITPSRFRTDLGRTVHLDLGPPTVIGTQVKDAVRRWRWNRVVAAHPTVRPAEVDICEDENASHQVVSIVLDDVLAKVLAGKTSPKTFPGARIEHRASLISAVSGGQWPQTRLKGASNLVDDAWFVFRNLEL